MSAPGQRAELSVRGQRPASRLVQQGIGTPGERGAGSGASMADPAAAPPALVRKVRRVLEIKETGERGEALRVFGDVSLARWDASQRNENLASSPRLEPRCRIALPLRCLCQHI